MSSTTHRSSEHRSTQRSRLSELLIRRDQIGTRWAESVSHARPEASNLTIELMVTEIDLADGWPEMADRWAGEWAIADVRKLHDPSAGRKPGCSICTRRSTPAGA